MANATLFGASLTRDAVANLPVITDRVREISGPRHKPVPHIAMVEEFERGIQRVGYQIVSESHAIGNGKKGVQYPERLYSTFVVRNTNGGLDASDPSYEFAVGMRRSNDQFHANQLVAGAHVGVCENGMFYGDAVILKAKSTTGFDPRFAMEDAVGKAVRLFGDVAASIERMKRIDLTDGGVRNLLFAAFVEGDVIENGALARKVWDQYRGEHAIDLDGTRHTLAEAYPEIAADRNLTYGAHARQAFLEAHAPDCAPRTEWGLHNAATRVFRDTMKPAQAMATSQRLGTFFGLSGAALN